MARPVVAERVTPAAPLRGSNVGALLLLLAVIGAGVAWWFYQEPIHQFATDLMSEVDAQMNRASVSPDRAPATAPAPAPAPLETAPAVTEDAPATVLAPGAKLPEATVSSPPPAPAAPPTTEEPVPTVDEKVAEATQPATAPPAAAAATIAAPVAAAPTATAPTAAAPATTPGFTRFAFQQDVTTVRESGVAARIVIRRTGDLSRSASVAWWTGDGTAVADADYADLGARIERFEPGEASRTVYIPLTNDAVAEPAKSFTIFLGRGESARDGEPAARARIDIVDDD